MKAKRQFAGFAVALMATLSLLASPLAACVCSHHSAMAVEAATDCHSHAHHQKAPSKDPASVIEDADECSCAANSPAAVTGTETLKIQKYFAAVPSAPAFLAPVLSLEPAPTLEPASIPFATEASYSFSLPAHHRACNPENTTIIRCGSLLAIRVPRRCDGVGLGIT